MRLVLAAVPRRADTNAAWGGRRTADCGCLLTATVTAMVTVTAVVSAARVTIDRLPLCVVALECTFGSEHLPCSAEWTADAAARQAAVKSHVVR